MTRDDIIYAQRILAKLDDLQKLKVELSNKFHSLHKNSSKEKIREVFEFIIENDASDILWSAIIGIQDEINKTINELEEELKAL